MDNIISSPDKKAKESYYELSTSERDALAVVALLDGSSGKEIQNRVEEMRGYEMTHGVLYPSLDGLAKSGYVTKESINGRENRYETTDEGERVLREYITEVSQ